MRATVSGAELRYEVSGATDGPWVTLVPGITNDLELWDDLVPELESFARVLRFDPRGHGASEAAVDGYSVDALMADIVGLWNVAGVDRTHVIGLGFGGSLAIGLAARCAERVRSLVAVCCRAVMTPDFIRMWDGRAEQVSTAGIESIVDATVTRWFTPSFAGENPGRVAAVCNMVRRTSAAGFIGHARAFATIDWSADLEQIDVPTLLVSAAGDPGGGRSDVMQSMTDSMRRATHVVVPEAGHICNIENPTAFNAIVVDFVQRYSTPSRLGPLLPSQLDEAQRILYDTITGGRRSAGPQRQGLATSDGALVGPFNAMLLSPPVGTAVQALGAALRFESVLTDRQRELAILLVAASWNSDFERTAHEAIGRLVGLTDDEIDRLSRREPLSLADGQEQATVAFVGHLLTRGNVDDSEYVEAVAALGTRQVYELATIVGHYSLLALNLRVFEGESRPSS